MEYSGGTLVEVLSYYRIVRWAIWNGWIAIIFRVTIYIINISKFSSRANLANSFLVMGLALLIVDKASMIVYDLQISFFSYSTNSTFALLKAKKGIPKTTSILVSAWKKGSLKNCILYWLFWSKNLAKIIL